MELSYHENWPEAERRLTAFWQGERLDRPTMLIRCRRDSAGCRPVPIPSSLEEKYTSVDFLCAYHDAMTFNTLCFGEAIPSVGSGLMAGWLPAYGASVAYHEDTLWYEETIGDWGNPPDFANTWRDDGWRKVHAIMSALIDLSAGRFFVGIPPYLPPNDLLSLLRGNVRFLMDLYDHPDAIKAALTAMAECWLAMYAEYEALIHSRFEGSFLHYPVWCPGRLGTLQSDVSCMVSSEAFETFIVPELERISGTLDYTIYHLDGVDAIRHLDRVLEIPGISMLQWVPGAGKPGGFRHSMPIFKRAQQKDRAIYLPVAAADLEFAIREFRPEKTAILISARAPAEARDLLKQATVWTQQYWT